MEETPQPPVDEFSYISIKILTLLPLVKILKNSALTQDLPEDASELTLLYERTLSTILDKHAPEMVESIVIRSDSP